MDLNPYEPSQVSLAPRKPTGDSTPRPLFSRILFWGMTFSAAGACIGGAYALTLECTYNFGRNPLGAIFFGGTTLGLHGFILGLLIGSLSSLALWFVDQFKHGKLHAALVSTVIGLPLLTVTAMFTFWIFNLVLAFPWLVTR